jgi:pyridoxamine 5'-phosphate oxidase
MPDAGSPSRSDPLVELAAWIEEARNEGLPQPGSVAFVTVSAEGRPSARTVNLKRLERDALIFTSALWTRKAKEIETNPNVSLLFHWPALGRQAHITGEAAIAERALAEELFSQRDLLHQLQTVVSRQGEAIDALDPLRDRLAPGRGSGDRSHLPAELGSAARAAADDRAVERSG